MAGIGMVLDIATTALSAQQQSINVTAHNIANVNTEGYSRQSPDLETKQPMMTNGLIMGRGVNVDQVTQAGDRFIENRLMQEKSNLSSSSEMEKYMQVLEGYFNENSDTGLSTMLTDFWNGWYDISNNPSGSAERSSLYEHSALLAEKFNESGNDLTQVESDLTNAVSSGIETINQITNQIAQLNNQIVGMEADNTANDLRDKRNALVSKLNEYLDVKTFNQSNGSLTIITAKGCTLVQDSSSYELEMGGSNGDRVIWQDSSGRDVDITNDVNNGKLGGWLDMRDEAVGKYQLDLDALAKEFIWSVNQQHSQGVGLEGFSSVTGSNVVSDTGKGLGTFDSGLDYYDKMIDGAFNLWIYDANGDVVGGSANPITIDAGTTTLTDLRNKINTAATNISAPITASISDGKLTIDAGSGYTFAFSDDTSNVLAALGINTFFTGSSAGNMGVNDAIGLNLNNIAAGQVGDDGAIAAGSNVNALAVTDLQNTKISISQWTCDRINGNTEGRTTSTIEDYYHSMVGAIGIASASVSRDKTFSETMVNEISSIRDSISGVSLDEELTNLIKYQHAYAAATKLISTSDEMLSTLLEVKK
ncbi:MAG: flagellar hook-associated protein FlgK [Desulfobacterales bacterium]